MVNSLWIGIDIGSQEVGLAVVEAKGALQFRLLACEAFSLGRGALEVRLTKLHGWLQQQLEPWAPSAPVYLEEPFVGRSVRSALVLGTVKGLLWGLLLSMGRPGPHTLPAVRIKKALTGRTHADKAQVATMLQHYLEPPFSIPPSEHASDAVAIAIAAACLQNSPITRKLTKRAER